MKKTMKKTVATFLTLLLGLNTLAFSSCQWIGELFNGGKLLKAIAMLENTFVDMEGIAAFGVWSAPDTESGAPLISAVSYIKPLGSGNEIVPVDDSGEVLPEEWDESLYDWESDYDWDPTKANVLIAINEDGTIDEVVYERTNGRGQVRQDALGNAASVYVSNGFTYVMYVSDDEWAFWEEINFAQEMRSPSGIGCHHGSEQTVVIHNATGKVFAYKDLTPQVNERSGATNYTLGGVPYKEDFLRVCPSYGNMIPQWYHVVYDDVSQKIRYDYMIPEEVEVTRQNNVRAVRRDKFGQAYLLFMDTALRKVQPGIVNLTDAQRYDDTLVFSTMNSVLFGSDGRMYAFHEGKLKVFGENFELTPVETGMKVALQGIAANSSFTEDGNEIAYQLIDGYLYSMFGEVWTVADDGTLRSYGQLEGVFPRCVEDGYLIGGEIIAIVDTQPSNISYSYNTGRMVQIRFDSTNGKPHATITHIMKANSVIVRNDRMVIEQNERPNSIKRGNTKYFLLSVQDGKTYVDYFAYGYEGGVLGLTKPITEPLILS